MASVTVLPRNGYFSPAGLQLQCTLFLETSLKNLDQFLTKLGNFYFPLPCQKNEIVKKQGGVSSSSTWRGATVAPTTGSGGASPACTPAWVWTRLGRSSQVRLRDRPASMVTRGFRGNAPETQRTQTTFEAYNCSPFFSSWNYEFLEATLPGKS